MGGNPPSSNGEIEIGMPFWALTRRAISSARASSSAASRSRAAARSAGSHCDHPAGSSKALRAAATAASTSASAASGTEPMFSSVLAEITSMVAELLGRTHSPPMNREP
ncbi:MAG TPA: hypothetical protein VMC83_00605 [Streptosporangiaceae bacterium]|nr:hypothetical protein [Streptosporangiaceae bacterium]